MRWSEGGSRGVKNANARLTEEQVIEIFGRLAKGDKQGDIAADYNVHETLISMMKTGRRWRHLRQHMRK